MTITFYVSDFLYELFSDADSNKAELKKSIEEYFTVGGYEPNVNIKGDKIEVEVDVDRISSDNQLFNKAVKFAEKGEYDKALKIAKELVESTPSISEYHRVLGQIQSEMGDQDKAIDSLIDALKWDPENEYALLMVGNIFAKYKNDEETAMLYYDQVLEVNPDDHLALNNIGVKLFEAGQNKKAWSCLNKAHKINPEYPNTLFALAMVEKNEGRLEEAFHFSIQSLINNSNKDNLYNQTLDFTTKVAKQLIGKIDVRSIIEDFVNELTIKTDTDIRMESDSSIKTAATIQYAEVYNRDHHLILYKPNQLGVEHLIVHELTHLELAHEAREENSQMLFRSNQSNKSSFLMKFKKDANKLKKKGLPDTKVDSFLESMHEGLNSQMFNTPIDLFIENRIYNRFEEIRPHQFLSILSILNDGIEANTRPDIIKITPPDVLSSSIVFNLVSALQFKDLYGVDLITSFKPKKSELSQAKRFYEEFQENKKDKKPGVEYDLIQFWSEDLKLDRFFELVPESQQSQKTSDNILDEIEKDPYGVNESDPSQEREMKQFLETHGDEDTNMAVAMYMVDALNFFDDMPKGEIKKIAFEIAHIGTTGIDPNKDGYKIPSIPNSNFSGYKTLAYYYTSWALAVPEMLSKLQMPFDEEFNLAKKLKRGING